MNTARKSGGIELPDGWRIVGLGEVAEVAFSNVDKRTVPEERAVLLCNYTDVFYNRRITAGMNFMAATATGVERDRWELKKGDVLFTKDSETADEIGIPSVVTEDMPGILCGYHLGLARPSGDLVDGAFLAAALNSATCRRHFTRVANGVTRFGLTLEAARSLPVFLPPLHEQRAIADVLDSIDEVIERTEAVIAATETLRDSLLHELLTRGVPGWHTEWKDVPGIGTIPANWEVVRLGEVIESSTYGTNEPLGDNGNIIVLRMNNIQRGEIDWSEVKRAELSERELNELDLQPGDILFNRTNSLDLVGKIAMVRDLAELTSFASYLVRIRTKAKRTSPVWLSALLGSKGYQSRIRRFATPGVSQANINPTSLKSLTIPLPSISEQANAIAVLDGIREQIQHARRECETLQQAKSALADALLSGRMGACNMAHQSSVEK